VCALQLTFLRLTNVASHKLGRRYVRTFAALKAAGCLDVSSNLDLVRCCLNLRAHLPDWSGLVSLQQAVVESGMLAW
jgi:hypothetical protein